MWSAKYADGTSVESTELYSPTSSCAPTREHITPVLNSLHLFPVMYRSQSSRGISCCLSSDKIPEVWIWSTLNYTTNTCCDVRWLGHRNGCSNSVEQSSSQHQTVCVGACARASVCVAYQYDNVPAEFLQNVSVWNMLPVYTTLAKTAIIVFLISFIMTICMRVCVRAGMCACMQSNTRIQRAWKYAHACTSQYIHIQSHQKVFVALNNSIILISDHPSGNLKYLPKIYFSLNTTKGKWHRLNVSLSFYPIECNWKLYTLIKVGKKNNWQWKRLMFRPKFYPSAKIS